MSKALQVDKLGNLKISEADVKKQCITWLELHGWTCRRQNTGKWVGYGEALYRAKHTWHVIQMGEDGDPDWLCLKVAATPLCRVFYLELKKPDGKLRSSQRVKIAALRKAGYKVCVAASLDELQTWMDQDLRKEARKVL